MSDEEFVARLPIAKVNPRMIALASLPILAAILTFAISATTRSPAAILAPPLLAGGAILHYFNWKKKPNAKREREHVVASRAALRIGDLTIPRDRIERALLIPRKGDEPMVVRVERRLRPVIDLTVRDEAEGRELLRALGFDASQTVVRFRALASAAAEHWRAASFAVRALPLVAALLVIGARSVPHGSWLFLAVLALAVLPTLIPTWVEVGADGVLVRWIGMKRFIGASTIAGVSTFEEVRGGARRFGVRLALDGGKTVSLPMHNRESNDDASALAERVRETIEACKRGDAESSAALLDRGERSIGEWVRRLKSVGAGASATLRTAAVDTERLWSLLESPNAAPKDRAAAAVALSTTEQDGAKARIRVAASAVAEPRLRVAMEAASNDDEAELEEALSQLEERT